MAQEAQLPTVHLQDQCQPALAAAAGQAAGANATAVQGHPQAAMLPPSSLVVAGSVAVPAVVAGHAYPQQQAVNGLPVLGQPAPAAALQHPMQPVLLWPQQMQPAMLWPQMPVPQVTALGLPAVPDPQPGFVPPSTALASPAEAAAAAAAAAAAVAKAAPAAVQTAPPAAPTAAAAAASTDTEPQAEPEEKQVQRAPRGRASGGRATSGRGRKRGAAQEPEEAEQQGAGGSSDAEDQRGSGEDEEWDPSSAGSKQGTKRARASGGGSGSGGARGGGGEEQELQQLTVQAQSTPSVAAALAAKLAPNVKLSGARSVGAMWQTWVHHDGQSKFVGRLSRQAAAVGADIVTTWQQQCVASKVAQRDRSLNVPSANYSADEALMSQLRQLHSAAEVQQFLETLLHTPKQQPKRAAQNEEAGAEEEEAGEESA